LILVFLIVALLIVVVGYIAVNSSQKQLQKTIGQKSITLATEKLDKIDRYIHGRLEQVQVYAKDLSFEGDLIQSNNNFDNLDDVKSHISKSDQQWVSASKDTLTDFMRRLIYSQLSEEIRQEFELKQFYNDKYEHSVFSEVFVTNKYGANAAQTQKTTDYYQADEKWWQIAKQHGVFVGDVEYDKSADVYALNLAAAIHDTNGNFAGVIKAVLNIQEVIDVIKQIKHIEEFETTEFKLLTKDGKVIYSTEEYEFLKVLPESLLSFISGQKDADYFIAECVQPGRGDELFAYAHSKGYKDFKSLGWILIIEHETHEVFAPIAKLKNRLLIISLSVAILAILLGLVTSTSISKSITKLRDTAAKIGEGNLDAKIEIKSNDEIGQLAVSFNDMANKLKRSYAKLEESYMHLEKKVQQRTEELSSTAVKLAEEIAERSQVEKKQTGLFKKLEIVNRELNDFAYIVSHDLKVPLRSIQTITDRISSDYAETLDEEGKEQIELLSRRVNRMYNLIDGVLQYSSAGCQEEEQTQVSLNELVPEVIDLVAPPANIAITVESQLPVLECGRTRITQVFQNLLSNAIKYMDKPKGQIKIGCIEENGFWKFSIADNGPGIEEKDFEKIFQIFQTVSPNDEFEGTGVGLTVAKKIIEMYGGRIWVKSKVGQGTTFFFTLPQKEIVAINEKLKANITR
jgi:signal transduction histidine kinase